jgi:hypothetical protein
MGAYTPRVPVERRYVEEVAWAVSLAQKDRQKESSFEYRHTMRKRQKKCQKRLSDQRYL